jgi:hypothetical protein
MRKQSYVQSIAQEPSAFITFKKGRQKITNNKVYLNDKSEFEIELFNGTTSEILAKIHLNDELISQGGIVLRPGERIFLDRYLDVAKKFKFETYDVSGQSEAVKQAIAKNGLVKVEFFRKTILSGNIVYTNSPTWTYHSGYWNNTGGNSIIGTCISTAASGLFGGAGTTLNSNNATYTSSAAGINVEQTNSLKTKSIETGRVGVGGDSAQKFNDVDMSFDYYAFKTFEYQILPTSQKVIEGKDIKRYCGSCGASSAKPSHRFCSACGNAL